MTSDQDIPRRWQYPVGGALAAIRRHQDRPLRWRIGDAIDEFAHQHLGFAWFRAEGKPPTYLHWWNRYSPFLVLCNRREMSYGIPLASFEYANTANQSCVVRGPGHDTRGSK